MPRIETACFGALDYGEDSVLDFPAGLPAFEDQTRFVLIEQPEAAPAVVLQSLLCPALSFLALPVRTVDPAYHLQLAEEDQVLLGFPAPAADLLCLAIVTVPAAGPPTANLMAPLVVNPATRRGLQAVRSDSVYSHRHPLFPDSREEPCS